MADKDQPRFFDLEEHGNGSEVVWQEPKGNADGVQRFFRRVIFYIVLMLIAGGAGYYIYLHLMGQKQLQTPVNTVSLPGIVRQLTVVTPPKKNETVEEQFIERKIRKIIKADKEIRVKRGDTFLGLLNYFYHGYNRQLQQKVKSANPQIKNFNSLRVGQYLLLPDVEEEIEFIERVPVKSAGKAVEAARGSIKVVEHKGTRSEHWMYIKGRIKNKTAKEQDFIKINVDFMDEERGVIVSDFTYVVGEALLQPGEEKDFFIMLRNEPGITQYELYVEYY